MKAVGVFIINDPLGEELADLSVADLKKYITKCETNARNAGMLDGVEPVALR